MEDLIVLYEDNHLIVVVKPQNMPTQGDSSGDEDLLTAVKAYLKEKYAKPGNVFLGLVHRLDRPTGGVMVFAKTGKAASRLSEQLREGEFCKKYLAVTVGTPRERAARLTNWLVKDEAANTVTVVTGKTEQAKQAILDYKVLESAESVALVDIRLITGRSHQARVQLQNIGTPVFGDARYGGDTLAKGHNLALWAYELSFLHPVTKDTMSFRVFPPSEKEPWKRFAVERYINVARPILRY